MTVATTQSSITYQGNSATTVWPFPFNVPAGTLVVVITDTLTVPPTKTPVTNYTVVGLGDPAGGSVTFPIAGVPIPATSLITLTRVVPFTQPTNFTDNTSIYGSDVTMALDWLEMQIQQIVNGTGQVPIIVGTSGSRYNADGTIEQWGLFTPIAGGDNNIVFPVVFPNNLFTLTAVPIDAPSNSQITTMCVYNATLGGFRSLVRKFDSGSVSIPMVPFFWRALGN